MVCLSRRKKCPLRFWQDADKKRSEIAHLSYPHISHCAPLLPPPQCCLHHHCSLDEDGGAIVATALAACAASLVVVLLCCCVVVLFCCFLARGYYKGHFQRVQIMSKLGQMYRGILCIEKLVSLIVIGPSYSFWLVPYYPLSEFWGHNTSSYSD